MGKISVIIPVYNVGYHIKECLKSLEKQTYDNFEIIIVNDGSTDDTISYVYDFLEKKELCLKIIEQKNSGVSVARNTGIKNASGEYLCFIDGDDMVHPKYLEFLFFCLKKSKTDLGICSFKEIPDECLYMDIFNEEIEIVNTEKLQNLTVMRNYLLGSLNISVWSLIIKKSILEKNNIYFTEGAKYSEDMEFVWKILSICKSISYTNQQLYYYKIRNGSAMSVIDENRMSGFILYKGLEEFISKHEPNFSDTFNKFGVSKWVWSTMWQIAIVSDDFIKFQKNISIYSPNTYMSKLIKFPNKAVAYSAYLYLKAPKIYYILIKNIGRIKMKDREFI